MNEGTKLENSDLEEEYLNEEESEKTGDDEGESEDDESKPQTQKPGRRAGNKVECEVCGKTFPSRRRNYLQRHMLSHKGEKSVFCEKCGKGFIGSWVLKEHDKRVHGGQDHVCDICGRSFNWRPTLERHKRLHAAKGDAMRKRGEIQPLSHLIPPEINETPGPPYLCTRCPPSEDQREFAHLENLKRHFLRLHVEDLPGGMLYSCHFCQKPFNDKGNLNRHLKTHTGEKPFSCGDCDMRFISKAELRSHRRVHTRETPYQCSVCGKCFTQQSTLGRHNKVVHLGMRPYKCKICPKTFKRCDHLNHHVQNVHGILDVKNPDKEMELLVCDVCGVQVKGVVELKKHVQQHDGNVVGAKFNCSECDQQYRAKGRLEKHFNKVHQNKVALLNACTICGLKYETMGRLMRHYAKIHRNENAPVLSCSICGKLYETKGRLLRHFKKIHNNENLPVSCCTICGKEYETKGRLLRHYNRIHKYEDTTFYKCSICEKKYETKGRLARHLKMLHNIEIAKDLGLESEDKLEAKTITYVEYKEDYKSNLQSSKTKKKPDAEESTEMVAFQMLSSDLNKSVNILGDNQFISNGEENIVIFVPVEEDDVEKEGELNSETVGDSISDIANAAAKLSQNSTAGYNTTIIVETAQDGMESSDTSYVQPDAGDSENLPDNKNERIIKMETENLDETKGVNGNDANMLLTDNSEIIFVCDQCHTQFGDVDSFTKHMGTHKLQSLYHCEGCNIAFNDVGELSSHLESHADGIQYIIEIVEGDEEMEFILSDATS